MKKIIRALLIALASVAMLFGTTTAAQARLISDPAVGEVMGQYWVSLVEYDGTFRPAFGRCIKIQRKAAGVWRDNVSTHHPGQDHCSPSTSWAWWIADEQLALNTTAIRIIVSQGPGAGVSKVNLCNSTDNCRVM